jgi:hypothetical protein
MSLFQEVAKHGLAYCAYNQAIITTGSLDNAQKLTLAQSLLSDVYNEYASMIDDNYAVCNPLSCADSCIIEVLNFINGVTYE